MSMSFLSNRKKFSFKQVGLIAIALLILTLLLMTQTSYPAKKNPDPDSAIGTWISQAKDSKMEIYKYKYK